MCQGKGLQLTSAVLRLIYSECSVNYYGGDVTQRQNAQHPGGACNFIKQGRLKIKGRTHLVQGVRFKCFRRHTFILQPRQLMGGRLGKSRKASYTRWNFHTGFERCDNLKGWGDAAEGCLSQG